MTAALGWIQVYKMPKELRIWYIYVLVEGCWGRLQRGLIKFAAFTAKKHSKLLETIGKLCRQKEFTNNQLSYKVENDKMPSYIDYFK